MTEITPDEISKLVAAKHRPAPFDADTVDRTIAEGRRRDAAIEVEALNVLLAHRQTVALERIAAALSGDGLDLSHAAHMAGMAFQDGMNRQK